MPRGSAGHLHSASDFPLKSTLPRSRHASHPYTPAALRLRVTVALLVLAGCSRAPVALRDDAGRAIPVPRKISRIVTLAPSLTEIVFAIGAGSRVVATDDFSNAPAPAAALPKVGGVQPSVEQIVAARPDLVLALSGSNVPSLSAALGAAHIPLFVARTERLTDVGRLMGRLGDVLSAPDAGQAVRRFGAAISAQHRSRSRSPRVVFIVWTEPLYVAGRETFLDDLLALTGARNAVDAKGWPQYSLESVVATPPDVILYPAKSVQPAQIEAFLRHVPRLRESTVVAVDENRFTRPGPHVGEAAADLNRILDAWERGR
jgi:iron complex transport system substrate-binding protein